MATINPYEEAVLFQSNSERERYDNMSTLFSLIVSLDHLERAYVKESISENEYAPACNRLLSQYKTILKLVIDQNQFGGDSRSSETTINDVKDFMRIYKMENPAASHRLEVGVPATIEHASRSNSTQSASERAKWVAETTQNFITFMDALKLKLRAKDQLHPLLGELVRGYGRSDAVGATSSGAGGFGNDAEEVRGKLLNWLIRLNQMKASDEIDEDQARQMLFDVEAAYNSFFRALQDG
ncbi:ESCRT-1 complex, Vps28 subunit [Violaceomyces palustris]|uniref:ESCRT-1 complex, Vps28 subunit n=1 Tax=Violaceomyces palustris TaxID=1673888 RepID=A0ACD0NQJ9_9BASI|nr:ESCRT-1 complex, Vps28 subunit [Violaceomyces palustris]